MMGGVVHKHFPECYEYDELELNKLRELFPDGMDMYEANIGMARKEYVKLIGLAAVFVLAVAGVAAYKAMH